ncbi:meiotic cell cortex C-terminal pleckstrin homology-domain-containing protein [Phakopsora pachyrhizi]|uniref:Meiotic cell cortex C-terminal pleckstrin homology-domain-containing protein n=1 Tax=Phakopsora pachyrhizi TaxID=170000 RepID=A0AAV0BUJ8_PHAPC|nr:meiotic cell cortex C-terminal pleckstrin homology-domain-containing protein [Phakopsora pachyrhizi]
MESECEQMFSADEEIFETDLEPEEFEDAPDSGLSPTRISNVFDNNDMGSLGHSRGHSIQSSKGNPYSWRRSAQLLSRSALVRDFKSLNEITVKKIEVGVQTEILDENLLAKTCTEESKNRDSVMTFGRISSNPLVRHAPSIGAINQRRRRTVSSASFDSTMEYLRSRDIASPNRSTLRESLASSTYSTFRNHIDHIIAMRDQTSNVSVKHDSVNLFPILNGAETSTSAANLQINKDVSISNQLRLEVDKRFVTPQSSAYDFRPMRPSSPPPQSLLDKVQTPNTASRLTAPQSSLVLRSSHSSMPPPLISRNGKAYGSGRGSSKKKATATSTVRPKNSTQGRSDRSREVSELGQFGELTVTSSGRYYSESSRRRANTALADSLRSSFEGRSQRSRGQSFSSERTDRTSDPGEFVDQSIRGPVASSTQVSTDPSAIHAITQTMIGEFLYKYTTKTLTRGFTEKRHRRFFWVHPYTKTLYWSTSDPGAHGNNQSTAKSVFIEGVRSIDDKNSMPPGLSTYSLVIRSPNREMKITAPSKQRHDLWLSAIKYLISRPESAPGVHMTSTPVDSPRVPQAGIMSRIPAPSLSRLRSYDPLALNTPPTVRSAIYGTGNISSNNSPTTRSSVVPSNRATPRAIKGPSAVGAPSPSLTKTGTPTADFLKRVNETRSVTSLKASLGIYSLDRNRKALASRNGGDESMEMVYESEVSMSYESKEDDFAEGGFEGLENVRACCDGKHDVGSLSRRHTLNAENCNHSHVPTSRPPSRGPLSIFVNNGETDFSTRSAPHQGASGRPSDSPSLRAQNLQSLRNRFGVAAAPASAGLEQHFNNLSCSNISLAPTTQSSPRNSTFSKNQSIKSTTTGRDDFLFGSKASKRDDGAKKHFESGKTHIAVENAPPRSSSRNSKRSAIYSIGSGKNTRNG